MANRFLFFRIAMIGLFVQLMCANIVAQNDSTIISNIVKEATDNSQLEKLAHTLLDEIGPRLVGSPKLQQAQDWLVKTYTDWGIAAKNEKWGEWRGWERGITHIDMLSPWVKSLEGTQLAWSPSTGTKPVIAEAIILPDVTDSAAFAAWLPSAKGKFVMISMLQPTGRPDYNWDEFGTKVSVEKMKKERDVLTDAWAKRIKNTGYTTRTLPVALEKAGAVGVISSYWSKGFGVDKIFGANTKKIPSVDVAMEDYGLLYRLTASGSKLKLSILTDSKEKGVVPTLNTIGEIKGTEKPGEYVMLSAHLDSWDGGTGATDNGTGTLVMMEAMRILQKIYPHPKRTILVGHWSSEEQGLNGSRAFVEDHPEIVNNMQVLFNQDNGTGRVVSIAGQGFLNAYDYIGRWLSKVPADVRNNITTDFPSAPGTGGSDFASFVAAGVPAFSLSSNSWSYGTYTWHTNRDTYDKIVFDDVRNNAILTAVLVYMACEDPQQTSREKIMLPLNDKGERGTWPEPKKPTRRGGLD